MFRIHRLLPLMLVVVVGAAIEGASSLIGDAQAQLQPGGSTALSGANIRATRHNLSSSAPSRQVTSGTTGTSEAQLAPAAGQSEEICVYCHTPHGAVQDAQKPLWNRAESAAVYTGYASSSLNATDLDVTNLAAPSKLCLSCHDGTIAIGSVSNSPGSGLGTGITQTGFGTVASPGGTMPYGRNQSNADHGFTRRLGTDLRNDHPISFTFDTALAVADGELRDPATSAPPSKIANRAAGVNFPLTGGKVQCTTCHDPHRNSQKFLTKNRLVQGSSPQTSWTTWAFDDANDQVCVGCHTRLGKAWQQSAHSNPLVANEVYKTGDGAMRDFPTGTAVWNAGCLNCHDTHTVSGSRRLLREGVNSGTITVTPGDIGYPATFRTGTDIVNESDLLRTSALENTCFQCHSNSPVINTIPLSAAEGVPNIEAEFNRTYHMPIKNADQGGAFVGNIVEKHDMTNTEGIETQTNLGFGMPSNRHAECTDCHNPHRVVRADTHLGGNLPGGDTNRRTHVPSRGAKGEYGNIASGVLRGAWGVEPSYTAFGQTNVTTTSVWLSAGENPTFTVKKGDPGGVSTLPVGNAGTNTATYLTREYQLCFKCHSSYANGPLTTDFPQLRATNSRGTTPSGSTGNGMTRYTNVAAEFAVLATDPPTSGGHQGEALGTNNLPGRSCGGADCIPVGAPPAMPAGTDSALVNHPSWHPVIFPTGRDRNERRWGTSGNVNLREPWVLNVGTQTMHCSDCHGNGGSYSVIATPGAGAPDLSKVQGPHGSDNPFLLKGTWSTSTTLSAASSGGTTWTNHLCGKCHQPKHGASGYATNHSMGESPMGTTKCMTCHIAVPHGWKNKAFLANMNCVGFEAAGATGNCKVFSGGVEASGSGYSAQVVPPYYNGSALRIGTWKPSGGWSESDCSGSMTSCGVN